LTNENQLIIFVLQSYFEQSLRDPSFSASIKSRARLDSEFKVEEGLNKKMNF